MKKQKIIIDAYQYDSAITGTDRMAFNFLRELQKIDTVNEYFVLCSSEEYIPSGIKKSSNFKVLQPLIKITHPLLGRVSNKIWRESTLCLLKLRGIDTYYTFHNMHLPRLRVARRMIASNLDLITLKLPDYSGLGRRTPAQEIAQMNSVAKKADLFVSISEYSKQELHKTLGVSPKDISVIPLAADPIFSQKDLGTNDILKLPKNFLFTLGGSEPRKNVMFVVDAFCALPKTIQKEFPLYIAGGAWHGNSLDVFKKSPFIHTLGYVSNESLVQLYRHTTAFIFASLYEGFGFMIVEAMTAGAPVLTADNTSLSEVASDAGIFFKTTDTKALAEKITTLVHDKNLQKELSKKGSERAVNFSWNKSARKLHRLLTEEFA